MKISTRILLAFLVILALSITDTVFNYVLSVKVKKNSEFLNRSQEIIRNSGRLHKTIIDMQSSFRGFLLAEDTNFLQSYRNGIRTVPSILAEQRSLVRENHTELGILDSITNLHRQWVEYANSVIEAKKSANITDSASALYSRLFETKFRKQFGQKLNDQITQRFLEFDRKEYELRSIRSEKLISSIRQTQHYSVIFFILTIIIGLSTAFYIVSIITRRIRSMVTLAEKISGGEFANVPDTYNDELTRLSVSLNKMSDNLRKNINELERRNVELDKFAYVVSHDLKAPLRGIHHAIKWIEEDLSKELTPEMKKYLDIIPQRTQRMEDLINGLLDYARIREKTIPEKTNVYKLVKDIIEAVVPRDFSVEIKILPVIITERLKLEQVFTNLISNAVKYAGNADKQIIIDCKELAAHYEFSVKDNGMGIEPEYHTKVFEIFQTLRERNEKESTGIGLAIVKKILDDQHCTIQIRSSLGGGAEFIFTWPKTTIN